jgi:hypothetical protein
MYSLIALFAGIASKLYDDLEDNNFLQKFRNNTLMEFLKGLHYISFTTISVEEPMFFIIQYVMNIAHSFGNKEGYNKPYEQSLLYSFFLLFIIIDYKKVTSFCVIDMLQCIIFILGATFETIAMKFLCTNSEYSFNKLIFRCFCILFLTILLYFFTKSNTFKFIIAYLIGYLFISVLVQLYSLYLLRMEKEEVKEEIKEKEEIEEVKEEIKEKEEVKEEEVKEEVKEEIKEEVKEEIKEEVK